ncbi:protein SMG7 [Thrips palmi]|uniref:Protein SMG7 n=1 Tax=Thrips palmi TaxID=161013 RepID=A0A6P8YDH2_THRPL|nr:protein SMG7 [Thrips palmi]XP_034234924.1 protein SMG7 [Thrips palmi]XP_034234925.1 protein SMG7 [Thrips palmi]
MGLNDAVQALKKADVLKEKVNNCRELLNDGDAWVWQQQLQRIYQQVLLQDLEYALDCKVEQELWNYGFKNYIGILQNMVKDKKNPRRTESQAMLSWCLEAASGFYLTLLQEICAAFDLDLSCRRRDSVYGISDNYNNVPNRLIQPNTTSCSYICQHCLVHLGDIARYRNQNRQAESFYRHAVQLSPHSGQPYNQLALLDSSRGDRLGTVFHYVKSVSVKHPFPAAATNLKRMFSRFAEDQLNLDGRSKLTVQEYVALFLKFHGMLYLNADLTACSRTIRLLTDTLTAQVATESFTSRKLVQMLAVNLYALHRARGNIFPAENERHWDQRDDLAPKLSPDEIQAKSLLLDLIAGSLSALLLPVYTIRENEALLEYFALPAIKLTLDWIRLEPHVLNNQAFSSRLQIWPSLCKLLNGLQPLLNASDQSNKVSSIPLPEDRELHGFLPLTKAMQELTFHCEDSKIDTPEINRFRASRLVQFGVWLSKQEENAVISSREMHDKSREGLASIRSFEALASGQAPSSELIRELEQLSLGVGQCPQQPSPSPSDAGSWGGSSTSTPGGAVSPPPVPPVIVEQLTKVPEKRTGILKPQGSLEKSREKEFGESEDSGLTVGTGRRGPRQNIAMQTILRKGVTLAPEADVKQVSFKTPSPTALDRNDGWTSQKSVQSQPNLPSSPLLSPTASASFSQPPPPLQQLQQQAQARVVHVPPPPIFPLPPMSVPPPSIRQNMLDASGHNFVISENAMQMRPPFGAWQEEALMPNLVSDSNLRNSWWPEHDQGPSQSRSQTRNLPVNMYNGAVNWGPMPPNQPQPQYQRPPPHVQQPLSNGIQQPHHPSLNLHNSTVQHQLFQPHSGSIPRQQEPQLHQGTQGSSIMFQNQQSHRTLSEDKCGDSPSNIQGFSPYSLFSTNNWLSPAISPGRSGVDSESRDGVNSIRDNPDPNGGNGAAIMGAQSLWSGPGPSPLERLLEQQKQFREGPSPSPKSGT